MRLADVSSVHSDTTRFFLPAYQNVLCHCMTQVRPTGCRLGLSTQPRVRAFCNVILGGADDMRFSSYSHNTDAPVLRKRRLHWRCFWILRLRGLRAWPFVPLSPLLALGHWLDVSTVPRRAFLNIVRP